MRWDLTPELIDEVIYAMENQEILFFYDIETGRLISEDQMEQEEQLDAGEETLQRLFELPRWRSHDGFHLMERFVAGLRNPVIREALRDALGSGKGVFRNFKNALHEHPQSEKLWYDFKEREMRKVVFDWFNDVRELHGLQKLSPPSEESTTQELIISDFLIEAGPGGHADGILELDRAVFLEKHGQTSPDLATGVHAEMRRGQSLTEQAVLIRAEAPSGELAGFAWATTGEDPLSLEPVARIVELAVAREYRGLGLGRALLEALVSEVAVEGFAALDVRLDGPALEVAELFADSGFTVTAQTMRRRFAEDEDSA